MWTWLLFGLLSAFICAFGTFFACAFAVRRADIAIASARDRALDELRELKQRQKAVLELPERLVELEESVESLRQSLKRLHSRAGMREIRERRGNGAVDWQKEPERWLAEQNKLIQQQRGIR